MVCRYRNRWPLRRICLSETLRPMTLTTDLSLGRRAMAMIEELARHTDEPGRITRLYLSEAHRSGAQTPPSRLMRRPVLSAHIDALGTVVGRLEGTNPDAPAILIGSHIDSVVDAGRYDGNLGVVLGIVAVEALREQGIAPAWPIEIVAFGDEENVRFPTNLSTSQALAGRFDPAWLDGRDAGGRHASRCADPLRRRSGGIRGARARPGALPRLSRSAYRAGTAPRSAGPARRHRLRHQRHHAGPRHRHRRGGPCRHRADGHAPRRAGGRRRDDRHRGARRLDPHRHGRDRRRRAGAARRDQRHSRAGRFHPRRALAGRCGAPRHGARTS